MTTAQAPAPGSTFDIPGVPNQSQWFDQTEDTQSLSFTPSSSVQSPVLGIADFRRTDVVFAWRHHLSFTGVSFTAGTGQTLTASKYAPYNFIGPTKLQIQNQYASVDVESGIDLAIFNLIRPFFSDRRPGKVNNYANPAGAAIGGSATGYLAAALAQPNLINAAQWTTSTAAFDLILDVPGGVWFDEYYQLGVDGTYQGAIPDCFVSPQYMAGTQRLIKTAIATNPLLGTTSDVAPVQTTSVTTSGATASSAAAAGSLTVRRRGVYGSNDPSSLPPPQPWQYRWKTDRFSINGVSQKVLQLPDDTGQLLCSYLRLFDPSAASGVGAPIELSSLSRVTLQYGSGLTWFDGTPEEAQALWLDQHGNLLPHGVIAFDFGLDELGIFSNKRAPNTLTTAGIEWILYFSSTTSTTAYAVMGRESLVYVT